MIWLLRWLFIPADIRKELARIEAQHKRDVAELAALASIETKGNAL